MSSRHADDFGRQWSWVLTSGPGVSRTFLLTGLAVSGLEAGSRLRFRGGMRAVPVFGLRVDPVAGDVRLS